MNRITSRHAHSRLSSLSYGVKISVCRTTSLHSVRLVPRRAFADLPPHTKMGLPALSPTMTKGNLVKWRKKEGDRVQAGEVIAEIETDKASMEFEAQEEFYIAKILVPEGTQNINVGTEIAVTVEDQKDVNKFSNYSPTEQAAPASAAPTKAPAPAKKAEVPASKPASSKKYPPHTKMGLPALSPTMKTGAIVKWRKKEGDLIQAGEVIAEIETDKASMEFEAQEQFYLAKILVPEGTQGLSVGAEIAITVEEKGDVGKFADYTVGEESAPPQASEAQSSSSTSSSTSSSSSQPQSSSSTTSSSPPPQSQSSDSGRVKASPYARVAAADRSIDLRNITNPTGPNGRIVKADVDNFKPTEKAQPTQQAAPKVSTPASTSTTASSDSFVDQSLSNIRKVIAQRLTESKNERPHYYLTIDCRVDKLLQLRTELNERGKGQYKLSVNDFIVKAAGLALREVPQVNSSWLGEAIRTYNTVDINVALSTERGLLTPLIRNADQKGLVGISKEVQRLAEKGRSSGLSLEEAKPGTFTISNLGMYGVKSFTAIINPPQSSILAVGAAEKRLIPAPQTDQGFEVGTFIHFTTSNDHRVLDGATSAQFLAAFRKYIEEPTNMLL